mmetsp:Transcript_1386/g.4710  ORF Transcript_1386/g.4710 Transcript_1386/m.4710 type:complete len:222 (-) Transcript_1386:1765-2430(-)
MSGLKQITRVHRPTRACAHWSLDPLPRESWRASVRAGASLLYTKRHRAVAARRSQNQVVDVFDHRVCLVCLQLWRGIWGWRTVEGTSGAGGPTWCSDFRKSLRPAGGLPGELPVVWVGAPAGVRAGGEEVAEGAAQGVAHAINRRALRELGLEVDLPLQVRREPPELVPDTRVRVAEAAVAGAGRVEEARQVRRPLRALEGDDARQRPAVLRQDHPVHVAA